MALVVHSDDMDNAADFPNLVIKRVYTNHTTFAIAVRPPGYHSRPHVHECEQVNYLISGELSMFMEGLEYKMRAGDFMCMPMMKVRWGWNRSSEPAVLVECHTPTHTFERAYPILDESEALDELVDTITRPVSPSYAANDDRLPPAPDDDPWMVRATANPPARSRGVWGDFETRAVYGETTDLSIATIPGGARTEPRFLYVEQIVYVLSGRLIACMPGRRFELRAGHFWRVPTWEPHWIANPGDTPCEIVTMHSPVLDPGLQGARPIFPPDDLRRYNLATEGHWLPEFRALDSLADDTPAR